MMIGFRNRHADVSAIERGLTRLADGTLDLDRRETLEQLVAGSPELRRRLREQRRAVVATRTIAQPERAPLSLRTGPSAAVRLPRRRPRPGRRPVLGLGLSGATAAVVATLVLATLGGGQAGLTVAQAATIALKPPIATVREPAEDSVTLPGVRAAGLPFPYWEDRDWRAIGMRRDRLDGRLLTTVFYRRGHETIAYTIVDGPPLPTGAQARAIVRAGTMIRTLPAGGASTVTWLRQGHSCVLSGTGVPLRALVELAARGGY
jgi:anti-sigma factor RsiW